MWCRTFGLKQATPTLTVMVLGYQVASTTSPVTPSGSRWTTARATWYADLDRGRARSAATDEVGRLDVPVAAGNRTRDLTATVKTSSRAITGEVSECRLT